MKVKVKPLIFFVLMVLFLMLFSSIGFSETMDELIDSLDEQYEAMVPPPNSSVNSDYKLSQAALGSLYTTKALNLIYRQNDEISEKYDALIEKYDKMIDQNKEIIRLLTIISETKKEEGTNKSSFGD